MVKKFSDIRLGPSQREVEQFFNSIKEWESDIIGKGKWIELDDPLAINFHENSKDFNECGSKIDSELLFQKIQKRGIEDIAEQLLKYFEIDELKDRLSFENYRYIQTFKVVDDYIEFLRKKKIQRKINQKQFKINELQKELDYLKVKKNRPPEKNGAVDFNDLYEDDENNDIEELLKEDED